MEGKIVPVEGFRGGEEPGESEEVWDSCLPRETSAEMQVKVL